MNLFRREGRRRRLPVAAFAGVLFAFQAIALVGASTAQAAGTCARVGSTVIISIDSGGYAEVSQDTSTSPDTIVVDVGGGTLLDCNGATVTNTTTIQVSGTTGDESFYLDTIDSTYTDTISWGTINWTVDLGSGTCDDLLVYNAGGAGAVNYTVGASGLDINNDGDLDVTYSGVEGFDFDLSDSSDSLTLQGGGVTGGAITSTIASCYLDVDGYDGDDTIVGSNADDTLYGDDGDDTITPMAGDDFAWGGNGDDTIVATVADGQDEYEGAAGTDTVDYSARTAALTLINDNTATSGEVNEKDEIDTDVEALIGGAGNDDLTANNNNDSLAGGPGDDSLDGASNTGVWADFSGSLAAVTVDLDAGTATGEGTDTLTDITNASGSAFDDSLAGDSSDNELDGNGGNDSLDGADGGDILDGGAGSDWADYSTRTTAVSVDLTKATVGVTAGACNDALEFTSGNADDVGGLGAGDCLNADENAALGSGDDSFVGNAFNNSVKPGGGQNTLSGGAGSDFLDYSDYTAGVTVNLAGGAASDDAIDTFENVKGTAFVDNITGDISSNTIKSGKGNDNLKGGSGDDTLSAGAGNDVARGGTGDDDLFGRKGNDSLDGGGGSDLCKGGPGTDTVKRCEFGH